jgi:hypothetical protein
VSLLAPAEIYAHTASTFGHGSTHSTTLKEGLQACEWTAMSWLLLVTDADDAEIPAVSRLRSEEELGLSDRRGNLPLTQYQRPRPYQPPPPNKIMRTTIMRSVVVSMCISSRPFSSLLRLCSFPRSRCIKLTTNFRRRRGPSAVPKSDLMGRVRDEAG